MKGYEALTEALVVEGMQRAFGLMTKDIVLPMHHWVRLGIPLVRARTEGGAVGMADGYARATGEPAVAIVGAGPGSTPTATALTNARKRRSPVLVIVGEPPPGSHPRQAFDETGFYTATAGHCLAIGGWGEIAAAVRAAYDRMRDGQGPAVLICPTDVLAEGIPGSWEYRRHEHPARPQRPVPGQEELRKAAELLAGASSPVVLAGRGAVGSGARAALEACGNRLGALMATTIQAPGLFAGHPYDLGHVGTLGSQLGQDLLGSCDCILAAGTSLDSFMSDSGQLFAGARVVHVDVRPDAIGRMSPVDVGLVGDARATVEALDGVLDGLLAGPREGYRTPEVTARLRAGEQRQPLTYAEPDGLLDPNEVADVLDALLPDGRVVVTDTGTSILFVAQRVRTFRDPADFFWTSDFGAVGTGLAVGIGVALGRPDQHTVVFLGDGAFLMSLHELDTAVRERVGMTVVVMNNEAFGSEIRHLVRIGAPGDLAHFPSPDIAAVARGLGCTAATVRDRAGLERAAAGVGTHDGPLVIDARIDRDIAHPARG